MNQLSNFSTFQERSCTVDYEETFEECGKTERLLVTETLKSDGCIIPRQKVRGLPSVTTTTYIETSFKCVTTFRRGDPSHNFLVTHLVSNEDHTEITALDFCLYNIQ
jgi:hypothetical protein